MQSLLAFKEQFIAKTVPAQVIGSSGSDLSRSIYIDKGDNAGVKPDMAVIAVGGIVGKVWIVYPSTSLVLMINDQSSGVGAMMEKSRLQGVVRGTPNGELILDRVMSDESVTPGETASGGQSIECEATRCSATFRYDGDSGWRDLIVQYFDTDNGIARFEVRVGQQFIAEWSASALLGTRKPDGSSATRRIIRGIALRRGDEIRIQGIPDAGDAAVLDYLEILPAEN